MSQPAQRLPAMRHYFVDEAGDATLFSAKGRVIVGHEGCSRFFILGLLDVREPDALASGMEALRHALLADPYFRGVPSMQPAQRKTALVFHAKDDLPEVRREVFALLRAHPLHFFAVVKNKRKVIEYVRQRNQQDRDYRYNANELYDHMVRRLFKNLLHKDDAYEVCFAKRGKADRTGALRQALEAARQRFDSQWSVRSCGPIRVAPRLPRECAALQAVDYFLWALQRLYERREDRFLGLIWPQCSLIHDVDDTRQARYGVYYTQKRPLTMAALEETSGI
jgi:hypothetical protein